MNDLEDVVVLSAVRTAIGRYGGGLAGVPPCDGHHAGYFDEQITPVQAPARNGTVAVAADEHIRPDVTAANLARLRPAFTDDGTVTAENASGVNDAAAAVCSPAAPTPKVTA